MEGIKLPNHKCGLYLTHNAHKDVYESVEEYTKGEADWISKEDRQECIDKDELWELQWYPESPVGFYRLVGSSLEKVLEAAQG